MLIELIAKNYANNDGFVMEFQCSILNKFCEQKTINLIYTHSFLYTNNEIQSKQTPIEIIAKEIRF
jgi:hypothetical protein